MANRQISTSTIIKLALLASFTFCLNLVCLQAYAADNQVKVAGQPVFTILSASGGNTASQRANTVQNNLDNALVAASDRSPQSVGIAYVRGTPVITVGGYQVCTVEAEDASAAHTTASLLATQWADSLRKSLGDQASVNSYVAQLNGSYAGSTAPAIASSSAPNWSSNNQTNSQATPFTPNNGAPTESYNNSSANFNSPGPNGFAPQGQGQGQGHDSGYQPQGGYPQNGGYPPGGPGGPGYRQGRVAYAPAGQIIPVTLTTSIATQVAKDGDLIQANISQPITLGNSQIPAGSIVIGQVTEAKAGRRLTKSGELAIKFNRLRTPDGTETPISTHIVGGIGKYASAGGDAVKGESMKNKVGSVAFRGLLGAGGGAALGTAVGAIAGGGYGAGMGAWSGAAIGGGLGAADSLLLRKGKDVTVPSGTNLQLQLDEPVSIAGAVPTGY